MAKVSRSAFSSLSALQQPGQTSGNLSEPRFRTCAENSRRRAGMTPACVSTASGRRSSAASAAFGTASARFDGRSRRRYLSGRPMEAKLSSRTPRISRLHEGLEDDGNEWPILIRIPPLVDRIKPGVRVLFVGINPGVRSAISGHHFAGFSNRFWKLLYESKLVPEPLTFEDDDRLPEFGFGITNIVPRATPSISTLAPAEYVAGRLRLAAQGAALQAADRRHGRRYGVPRNVSRAERRREARATTRTDRRHRGVRATKPQRAERQLHACRDAGGVSRLEAPVQ